MSFFPAPVLPRRTDLFGDGSKSPEVRKAVEPPGERAGWKIISEIATRMGSGNFTYASPEEISRRWPAHSELPGISYEKIDKTAFSGLPYPRGSRNSLPAQG